MKMLEKNIYEIIAKTVESNAAQSRIIMLLEQVQAIIPQKFEDLFISETRDSEGRQSLSSVFGFTSHALLEFKDPLRQSNWEIVSLLDVEYLDVNAQAYDFDKHYSDLSMLYVMLITKYPEQHRLHASRENCMNLHRILQERLVPRMRGLA